MTSVLESRVQVGNGPRKHTLRPIVTGTSIVAVKYKGGVMMAGDTLGSYGSLSRFKDLRRIVPSGKFTLVGADGDYSDFQYIKEFLKELEVEEKCHDDGLTFTPKEIYARLARLLYYRRTKMNPLWNNVVVAGFKENGETFLGTSDKIGTAYEEDFVATGMGLHMAMPILREKWQPDMSKAEAKALLSECLRVLFYRDCRTINKITFAKVDSKGARVSKPEVLSTEWEYQTFINPSGDQA